jgi:GNAT superfamily N-acetyltransferase
LTNAVIHRPTTHRDLDDVRDLMRAFIAWHRARHQQDLELIDEYFDAAEFERELATLPGSYAPPEGELLVASRDGISAGCVAMKSIDAYRCEMKRMFVYPQFHGQGIGRALGEAIVGAARAAGYQSMLLDTSIRQNEAQALYRDLGFHYIDPYYDLPDEMKEWLVFMELDLQERTGSGSRKEIVR